MKIHLPIKTSLLFVGSFVLINAAMYFLLKGTQPKSTIPAMSIQSSPSDSTVQAAAVTPPAQTTAAAKKDTTAAQETSPATPVETPTQQETKESPVAESGGQEESSTATTESAGEYETPTGSQEQTEPTAEFNESEEPDVNIPAEELSNVATQGNPRQIQRLAKVLEAMKPEQAALIVTRLPDDTIVAVFMKMRERPAAKILALLPVEQAARISQLMIQIVSSG
jgi:flagellar motility protein MotE (MotC chaperone)